MKRRVLMLGPDAGLEAARALAHALLTDRGEEQDVTLSPRDYFDAVTEAFVHTPERYPELQDKLAKYIDRAITGR